MVLMPLAILVAAGTAAALIGRRVVIAWASAPALAHVAWIVRSHEATSEDSTTTVIGLSVIFIYVPAFLGLVGGLSIGHGARSQDHSINRH
ncbi:MAG: hypothetical protein JWO02_2354 [Solirubrobacterales bacterium]|nr:hypothetical protein [Solirubrobacterales bacterium]